MSAPVAFPGLVLFRAAAGPRIGFGHLMRCRSLARALGARLVVSLRGSDSTRERAASLGASLVAVPDDMALANLGASLVVIDDPSQVAAARWLTRARRAGVPVASVHDLGAAYLPSDLVIDGTVRAGSRAPSRACLLGPAYAILDPALVRTPRRRSRSAAPRVLIALGGGAHVLSGARALTAQLQRALPGSDVRVATGFSATATLPALPFGRWIAAPHGLAGALASADAAIVAGGMTAYEACALGVPTVAVALNAPQHITVRGLARAGALIDGGRLNTSGAGRVASLLARLLRNSAAAAAQGRTARFLVDGDGARRVAVVLRALARQPQRGARHAA